MNLIHHIGNFEGGALSNHNFIDFEIQFSRITQDYIQESIFDQLVFSKKNNLNMWINKNKSVFFFRIVCLYL